jgi:uncharacterized protein YdhG (YjbR/CyaY superfamily)
MATPRYGSIEEYLQAQTPAHRVVVEALISAIRADFPDLELVLAWNVPHFKRGKDYVAGISTLTHYAAFSPWSEAVMDAHRAELGGLESTKHLIRIPLDGVVDRDLIRRLVQARLAELV